MKRFLVTGGAGFIGSHIVESLLKKGYLVRVLDNFSSGKKENLLFTQGLSPKGTVPGFELIRGDIRNKNTCLKVTHGVSVVMHQAALRSVPKSMLNPQEYNEVNIGGTLNMLESCVKNKIKCFVFASSSSVYGDINTFPEKENFLPQPISPYALSKLTGEHYCQIFSRYHGLPTVALRYFNVFGPRQALDDEYAVVIPKFISCMLKNESPPIYGTGRQSRDFTYIDNVVAANIAAARSSGLKSWVINVACGKDYSILDLVRMLNRIMRKNIKPAFLPLRPGDVFRTKADISKLKKMLGGSPKIDFIRGLEETVEYFRSIT